MLGTVCGVAAGSDAASAYGAVKHNEKKLPNIIVFLVDDMGWVDATCSGSEFYRTPNIDSLAANGMRFTDAYSACTVSSPTRAALMTGKYPARLHLTDFIAGQNFSWAKMSVPEWTKYLPLEEVTVAEVLKDAGYRTWHVGKWHLGNDPIYYPQNQGFDVNIGGSQAGAPGSPTETCNGYFSPYCKEHLTDGPRGEYLTDRLTDEAIALIRANDDTPFYLNMAHYAVHLPLQAKPGMAEKYEDSVDENYFQQNTVYAAMIESMDESLGRIVQTLREEKLLDNTLIIFASDNGALYSVSESHPLRAGKGSEYEGGVRTPLIISWPGYVARGVECDYPVITMDITTTLMTLVGSAQADKTDGQSLLPLITGGSLPERPLFWHYPHYHNGGAKTYSAVRLGDWKLIEQLEDNSLELYNLKEDIGETHNLAAEKPEKARELFTLLDNWRKEVGAQLPTPNPNYDPAKAHKKNNK